MRGGRLCGTLDVKEEPELAEAAMGRDRIVRRRSGLARAVERATVVERPVVCRGPLYIVHPGVTAACAGALQRIAVLLRDETHPVAPSALDAVETFVLDGASPFFGRDAESARRAIAALQHVVESGPSRPRGRLIARRARSDHASTAAPAARARSRVTGGRVLPSYPA
jgi:hypothetical protein